MGFQALLKGHDTYLLDQYSNDLVKYYNHLFSTAAIMLALRHPHSSNLYGPPWFSDNQTDEGGGD